jgi:hypothetical protein
MFGRRKTLEAAWHRQTSMTLRHEKKSGIYSFDQGWLAISPNDWIVIQSRGARSQDPARVLEQGTKV